MTYFASETRGFYYQSDLGELKAIDLVSVYTLVVNATVQYKMARFLSH